MRTRRQRIHISSCVGLALLLPVVLAPRGARASTDLAGEADRTDSESYLAEPPRQPSAYSLRVETGIGFVAGHVGVTFEAYPARWLSVGVDGGWSGQWVLVGFGHAYGGGLTLGGRIPIRFGYVIFNLLGGVGHYSETSDPFCFSMGRDENGNDPCPGPTTHSGTAALMGASVTSLFNVGRVQMGPMLRYDRIADMNIVTINIAVGLPRS